jgi:selenide,water dikinase
MLELARGSSCTAHIDWSQVPLLSNVQHLADEGIITGASDRNWQSYGDEVGIPADFTLAQRALLTDPQTSGGLLVSCSPDCVKAVLDIFNQHQFLGARVIGQMSKRQGKPLVVS